MDRPPVPLLVLLFVTALLGRFSVERMDLDLRIAAVAVLGSGTVLWRLWVARHDYRHTWGAPGQSALLLLGYLICSALWAPPQARAGEVIGDLLIVTLLFAVSMSISAPDPDRSARVLLYLMLGAGLGYAVLGLGLGQTTAQGRLSLFGGGPNVYVRVVLLGVLAAVALSVIRRNYTILVLVGPMLVAGLLSGSRGGLIAAGVTILAAGWFYRSRVSTGRLLMIAAVAAAGYLGSTALVGTGLIGFVEARFQVESHRSELLGQAWAIFLSHPVSGGGLDSFYASSGFYGGLDYAHNFPASVAADGGLVGLGLLVLLLASVCRSVRPVSSLSIERGALLLAAVYVATASLFSGDYYDTRFAWLFVAVAMNVPAVQHDIASRLSSRRSTGGTVIDR